jgi:hypothetical protein
MTDSQAEPSEPIVMSDLAQSAMQLCAARHDETVDYDSFTNLVYDLVDKAKHEERERAAKQAASMQPPPSASNGRGKPKRRLTHEDVATIKNRVAAAKRTPNGNIVRGFKDELAAELGLSKSQINIAIYDRT